MKTTNRTEEGWADERATGRTERVTGGVPQTRTDRINRALGRIATYCMICSTKLATKESKRFRACGACRKFCPHCGLEATHLGHFGVCLHCVPRVNAMMHGKAQSKDAGRTLPYNPVICESCGEESLVPSKLADRRRLCKACTEELTKGGLVDEQ